MCIFTIALNALASARTLFYPAINFFLLVVFLFRRRWLTFFGETIYIDYHHELENYHVLGSDVRVAR